MVSYVILGSHVTFYEAMTKINKTLPAAYGSVVKLTKGHVVSRKWVHQNGGSKHNPIASDLKYCVLVVRLEMTKKIFSKILS